MGPRSEERGRPSSSQPTRRTMRSFNGAAFGRTRKGANLKPAMPGRGWLQWGRVRKNAEGGRCRRCCERVSGFNGAAFGRTRKVDLVMQPSMSETLLQWGRVRKNAEGFHEFVEVLGDRRASMGPRSEERGRATNRALRISGAWLQWGRVRKNAEGQMFRLVFGHQLQLQWGRVRKNAEGDVHDATGIGVDGLQWGRVRKNAEGRRHGTSESVKDGLQWGRVRKNAEGTYLPIRPNSKTAASMGPRSEERGRQSASVGRQSTTQRFNGAAFGRTRKDD